ncbi:MAG: VOC family protein [Bdellovibrionales bacterium]|nr:VOC family protein [Bdellovibrionales bacterium]
MIRTLDHINIVVSNLEASKEFFLALGLELEDEAELEGDWIARIVGFEKVRARYAKLVQPGVGSNERATRLELLQYLEPPSYADPNLGLANGIGFRHMAFEVEDIEQTVGRLRALGVEFLGDVQTYSVTGKKLVYFHGPDGILLELAEYSRNT